MQYSDLEKIIPGLYIRYDDTPLWLKEWYDDNTKTYSDVIPIDEIHVKLRCVAFISINKGEINYVSRVRRDKSVVTKKVRVFFEKTLELDPPLLFADINKNLGMQLKKSMERLENSILSEVTGNQWNAVFGFMYNERKKQLEALRDIVHGIKPKSNSQENKIIIRKQEKEAICLSLRLAEIYSPINDIKNWNIDEMDTPAFLKNICAATMREDQMIINDFGIFGDWEIVKQYRNNIAVFSNGTSRVSVMNVNRTPIETALGVDLFYYNYEHDAYIFVQYKRMTSHGKKVSFKMTNDSQFLKDIDRMNRFLSSREKSETELNDYRFQDEMFYFKFCKDKQSIEENDLSAGMYLPKTYVEHLQASGVSEISYELVEKYFTNTHFIEMIKTGFYGSRKSNSADISRVINELIDSGNSVIIAVKNRNFF